MLPDDFCFGRTDCISQFLFCQLFDIGYRAKSFQQLVGCIFADAFDALQFIDKSALASLLTVKADAKAVHFIPYPADQV